MDPMGFEQIYVCCGVSLDLAGKNQDGSMNFLAHRLTSPEYLET